MQMLSKCVNYNFNDVEKKLLAKYQSSLQSYNIITEYHYFIDVIACFGTSSSRLYLMYDQNLTDIQIYEYIRVSKNA